MPQSTTTVCGWRAFLLLCFLHGASFFSFSFSIFPVSHVVKHKLAGHLLRCNSRQSDAVYYHRDLHLDSGVTPTVSSAGLLRTTEPALLAALVAKIEGINEKLEREEVLQERILAHPQLQEEINQATKLSHLILNSRMAASDAMLNVVLDLFCLFLWF